MRCVSGFWEITCSLPGDISGRVPGRHVTGVDVTQGKESITKVEENGDVVMVMERRTLDDGREGQLVLRVRSSNSSFCRGSITYRITCVLTTGKECFSFPQRN